MVILLALLKLIKFLIRLFLKSILWIGIIVIVIIATARVCNPAPGEYNLRQKQVIVEMAEQNKTWPDGTIIQCPVCRTRRFTKRNGSVVCDECKDEYERIYREYYGY